MLSQMTVNLVCSLFQPLVVVVIQCLYRQYNSYMLFVLPEVCLVGFCYVFDMDIFLIGFDHFGHG